MYFFKGNIMELRLIFAYQIVNNKFPKQRCKRHFILYSSVGMCLISSLSFVWLEFCYKFLAYLNISCYLIVYFQLYFSWLVLKCYLNLPINLFLYSWKILLLRAILKDVTHVNSSWSPTAQTERRSISIGFHRTSIFEIVRISRVKKVIIKYTRISRVIIKPLQMIFSKEEQNKNYKKYLRKHNHFALPELRSDSTKLQICYNSRNI